PCDIDTPALRPWLAAYRADARAPTYQQPRAGTAPPIVASSAACRRGRRSARRAGREVSVWLSMLAPSSELGTERGNGGDRRVVPEYTLGELFSGPGGMALGAHK